MKIGIKRIIFGFILIVLQILSLIGRQPTVVIRFDNPLIFLYDSLFWLSYFAVGILGAILLLSGIIANYRIISNNNTVQPNNSTPDSTYDKITKVIRWISISLTITSIIAIIVALNNQDIHRNTREQVSPTMIYFLILGVHCAFLVVLLFCKTLPILQVSFSLISAISTVVTLCEGTVFSDGYYNQLSGDYQYYRYNETVSLFNGIWVFASLFTLLIQLPLVFRYTNSKWHSSVIYRDRCYRKVEKMHNYLNSGVITQEEFEKAKSDILRKI